MATFTSSSTVTNFVELARAGTKPLALPEGMAIGCIGPITADTARTRGLEPVCMPDEWTIPAFVDAISAYFAERPLHE
jgi:uroporphyrinogen III methyltransferase/synthase